jgi:hypothetical protein
MLFLCVVKGEDKLQVGLLEKKSGEEKHLN